MPDTSIDDGRTSSDENAFPDYDVAGDMDSRRKRGKAAHHDVMTECAPQVDMHVGACLNIDGENGPGTNYGALTQLDRVRRLDARMNYSSRTQPQGFASNDSSSSLNWVAERHYVSLCG